jgi:hypothetical protein
VFSLFSRDDLLSFIFVNTSEYPVILTPVDTDIKNIAAMGVKAYSFSISWSRVMPFGRGPVNEQALAHYMDVIDTCIENNVEPIVTL